jgi:hypothetical protein
MLGTVPNVNLLTMHVLTVKIIRFASSVKMALLSENSTLRMINPIEWNVNSAQLKTDVMSVQIMSAKLAYQDIS